MFDLSKIITGLNDLKETIAKNRVKNLRADLAGRIFIRNLEVNGCSPNCLEEEGVREYAEESVQMADIVLKVLGEKNA